MNIRSKLQNFETRFFSNLGILENSNIKENVSSTWRLDYPNAQQSTEEERFIILLAQKILSRGNKVTLSPSLENELRLLFDCQTENLVLSASDINHFVDTNPKTLYEFDSPLEKIFFEKVLPQKLGKFFKKFVLYQPHIITDYPYGRVDFLLGKKTVIELDGEDHNQNKQKKYDEQRDIKLKQNGFDIIRISNEEIKENNLEKLDKINYDQNNYTELTQEKKTVLSVKLALQIQLVLCEIIYCYGFTNIKTIYFNPAFQPFTDKEELKNILSLVLSDFKDLLSNIRSLYGLEIPLENISLEVLENEKQNIDDNPFITFAENITISQKPFIIQDIVYNKDIDSVQDRLLEEKNIQNPSKEIIEFFLNYIFRHKELRDGQLETIQRILQKKDTITLLPTGAGKSICFQLPSFLFIGNTLIICPITSLMDDQVENLNDKHNINKVISIHSKQDNREEIIQSFKLGKNIFTYVAPERFQINEFRNDVQNLKTTIPISLIAIDEAHCLSEWGHDFRVAYLHISKLTRSLTNNNTPLLALTGTASYSVLNDIKRDLDINQREAIITPKTFDRKELDFFVVSDNGNKEKTLISVLQKDIPARLNKSADSFKNNPQNGGIIFCPHTTGEYGINICDNLKKWGFVSAFYSSTMKDKEEKSWHKQIKENVKKFKKNELPLLVATKAFGMGIDKPNIRYTIHYGIPQSIESYYQEAGRAGRDRKNAVSFIIFSNTNNQLNEQILNLNTPFEEVREKVKYLAWEEQDDVIRQIGFHVGFYDKESNLFKRGSFISKEKEESYFNEISDVLLKQKQNFIIYTDEEKLNKEKAIYRLSILGIVNDYTIDYSKKHFDIDVNRNITNKQILDNYANYVSSYNRSKVRLIIEPLRKELEEEQIHFIKSIGKSFIEFIYNNIEKSRRRSLREMFLLAKEGLNEKNLVRKRILNYLETNYSEEIEELIGNEFIFGDEDIKHLKDLVKGYAIEETGEVKGGIRTSREALDIRGEVVRYLESQPDHPELLFLRSISEMFCSDCNEEIVVKEFNNCIAQAKNYKVEDKQIIKLIIYFLEEILQAKKNSLVKKVLQLIKEDNKILNELFKYDFQNIDLTKYIFYNLTNNKLKNYLGVKNG